MKPKPILRLFQAYLEDEKYLTRVPVMAYLRMASSLSEFMEERGKNILEISVPDIEEFAAAITHNEDLTPIREFLRFINKKYGIDTVSVIKVLDCGFKRAVRRHHKLGTDSPKPLSERALSGCRKSILHEFSEYMKRSGVHEKTIKNSMYYFSIFEQFLADHGKTPINAEATAISDFLEKCKRSYSAKTLSAPAAAVRKFYVFLSMHAEDERITAPIQVMLETPTGLNSEKNIYLPWLDVDVINTLITTPSSTGLGVRDAAMLGLGYACGLTPGQIQDVLENHIKIEDNAGYVEILPSSIKKKGTPMLRKAFGADVAHQCQRYQSEVLPENARKKGSKYLFLSNKGNPLCHDQWVNIIRKYARIVGIKTNVTPSILRNSHIIHLLKFGMPAKIVAKTMGMANQTQTFKTWEMSLNNGPVT